jgi:methylated-DNA-protein-cysteine methyltransferase-like protein
MVDDEGNISTRILNAVKNIPRGYVASYGHIAALAGSPRAARVVGWTLGALPQETDIPWQRVVNKDGYITIENLTYPKEEQARMLEAEGVTVQRRDGLLQIDMEQFGWKGRGEAGLEKK